MLLSNNNTNTAVQKNSAYSPVNERTVKKDSPLREMNCFKSMDYFNVQIYTYLLIE